MLSRTEPSSRRVRTRPCLALLALLANCSDEDDGPPETVVVGEAVVSWSFETPGGQSLDCSAAGVTRVEVLFGGPPAVIDCGEIPSTSFGNLASGQFPVLLRAFLINNAEPLEHGGQVMVQAGSVASYEHTFVVDPPNNQPSLAEIELLWQIEEEPANTACTRFGVQRVRIQLTDGPDAQDDVDLETGCASGTTTLRDLQPGSFRLRLDLLNSVGEIVGTPAFVPSLRLAAGTNQESINFFLPLRGTVLATWTVDESPASDACPSASDVLVEVLEDRQAGLTVASATVACPSGSLFMDGLPTSVIDRFRVSLSLRDTSFGTIVRRQQVVSGVELSETETASVSIDFIGF